MKNADDLVSAYLKELRRQLRDLPPARRKEIVEEISAHIADARAQLPTEDEASMRELLERVGDPDEIAAEARLRVGSSGRSLGLWELGTLVLLLVGGVVVPVVGWVVGVFLLWTSSTWTVREKIVGTAVVPGGLLLPLLLATGALLGVSGGGGEGSCVGQVNGPTTCVETASGASRGSQVLGGVLLVAALVGALAGPAFLAWRAKRRPLPLQASAFESIA